MLQYDTQSAIRIAYNPYQGRYKRVLCVCSAGVLRSATAAVVLSQEPYNCNTRSAGVEEYALVPINDALLVWADEIICMTRSHERKLLAHIAEVSHRLSIRAKVHCLDIPDDFPYRDPQLIEMIKHRYDQVRENSKG